MIRHEVDGLLVDPLNSADIGAALVRLLKDPAQRTALGQAGQARAASEFSWDRVTDRVEAVNASLVASLVETNPGGRG